MGKRRYPVKEPYTWWWENGYFEGFFDAYPQYRVRDIKFESLEYELEILYDCIIKGLYKCETHKRILTINKPKFGSVAFSDLHHI